jgi:hypothetical protein
MKLEGVGVSITAQLLGPVRLTLAPGLLIPPLPSGFFDAGLLGSCLGAERS